MLNCKFNYVSSGINFVELPAVGYKFHSAQQSYLRSIKISANPLNQRHLRSIKNISANPLNQCHLRSIKKISANPLNQRHLRSIKKYETQQS